MASKNCDDRCYREENEFDMYWGIEEPYWSKLKVRTLSGCITKLCLQNPPSRFHRAKELFSQDSNLFVNVYVFGSLFWPSIVTVIAWLIYVLVYGSWDSFEEPMGIHDLPCWFAAFAIVFVSSLTASCALGGTSLMLPLFHVILGVSINNTRQLYFLGQSLTAVISTFTSTSNDVPMDTLTILWGSIGSVGGVIFGFETLPYTLDDTYATVYGTAIRFAFALCHAGNAYQGSGRVFRCIPEISDGVVGWRAAVLLTGGFLGGLLSTVSGPGAELYLYALLTLFFQVSERVVVPTVVTIAGISCAVAAFYQEFRLGGTSAEAAQLWLVCIPSIAIVATLGALLGAQLHRLTIVSVVLFAASVQVIVALCVLRPWTTAHTLTPEDLCVKAIALLVFCLVLCGALCLGGQHLLGLVGTEGLHDESLAGDGKPIVRRLRVKKSTMPTVVGTNEEDSDGESKSDDLEESSWEGSLYPPRDQLSPPERSHVPLRLEMPLFSWEDG